MSSLRELYQEIIVDHGRHPRHFGKLANANHSQEGHNPLCGDKVKLYVCEENGVVQEALFEGSGCAIAMASASLMLESIKGKTLVQIEKMFASFHRLVTQGICDSEIENNLGKLAVFQGVAEFPVRVKCATLAWHTLNAALLGSSEKVSTE